MPADLSITFTNLSTTTFERSAYERWESAVDVDAQLPEATLKAPDTQVMAINNSFIAGTGAATFWCCWFDPTTKARFGVKIVEKGQPFGMGYAPWWQVMADHNPNVEPSWQTPSENAANPYRWDPSIGFRILATPECTHETLRILVMIRNLEKT